MQFIILLVNLLIYLNQNTKKKTRRFDKIICIKRENIFQVFHDIFGLFLMNIKELYKVGHLVDEISKTIKRYNNSYDSITRYRY
jgi:uncharacterized protein YoxC